MKTSVLPIGPLGRFPILLVATRKTVNFVQTCVKLFSGFLTLDIKVNVCLLFKVQLKCHVHMTRTMSSSR